MSKCSVIKVLKMLEISKAVLGCNSTSQTPHIICLLWDDHSWCGTCLMCCANALDDAFKIWSIKSHISIMRFISFPVNICCLSVSGKSSKDNRFWTIVGLTTINKCCEYSCWANVTPTKPFRQRNIWTGPTAVKKVLKKMSGQRWTNHKFPLKIHVELQWP